MGLLGKLEKTYNNDKIMERLRKFYKDKMRVIGLCIQDNNYSASDSESIVKYLLNNKGKNLSDNKQIADALDMSQLSKKIKIIEKA